MSAIYVSSAINSSSKKKLMQRFTVAESFTFSLSSKGMKNIFSIATSLPQCCWCCKSILSHSVVNSIDFKVWQWISFTFFTVIRRSVESFFATYVLPVNYNISGQAMSQLVLNNVYSSVPPYTLRRICPSLSPTLSSTKNISEPVVSPRKLRLQRSFSLKFLPFLHLME